MKSSITTLTVVTLLASHAAADVTPVRSSVESTANVRLTVVEISDEQTSIEDQGATTDSLGPVFAGANLSTSDGIFESSTTGTVVFTDASQGTFSTNSSFSGIQTATDPDAQRLGVTLNTTFQYDFYTAESGTVNFTGTIFNGGVSIVSYYVNVRFNKETTPGGGFNGAGTQQQILDMDHNGELFDFSLPLDSPTGNYRIEIVYPHSSLGSLNSASTSGSLNMSFSIITDSCAADFTDDGTLDIFDVIAFINAFNTLDPSADFTEDGVFDIFDVLAFIEAFNTGCP